MSASLWDAFYRNMNMKKKLAAVVYRYPRLYRRLRPIWLRLRWWSRRLAFQAYRLVERIPEPRISVTPTSVGRYVTTEASESPNWDEAAIEFPYNDRLAELVVGVVEGADLGKLHGYREVMASFDRGERPYGFVDREEFDTAIEQLRGKSTVLEPELEVWLGRNGEILLRRGQLQLALARARGLDSVSASVGRRHSAWERLRVELAFVARKRGGLYQKVLHPDLDLFPALQVCVDRIRIVEGHLPDEPCTALDLGANFGEFSRFLEDKGYRVIAVEEDPASLHYLRLIRDTMGYAFEIFPQDVRVYEGFEPIDLLWAMSVLHFFTKNEADQQSLIELLGRLSPKVVMFQPPRSDEYRRRGWYRIYEPDDFADLIRTWCGLSKVQRLGVADNGRPIYKIS